MGSLFHLAKLLVSLPFCLFLAIAVGLLLRRRRPRTARWLIGLGASALVLSSVPWCAAALLRGLQRDPPLAAPADARAGAIVVLSADAISYAPELAAPTVGRLTLERLRYAAHLARATGLPLLATGGASRAGIAPRAELMRRVLEDELDVPVRWLETSSGDTLGNARHSRALLAAEGVERVLLVTHAWHMPRARLAFESAGLEVVAAPTAFRDWPELRLASFVPSARSLQESAWAVHEWIGWFWYALRT